MDFKFSCKAFAEPESMKYNKCVKTGNWFEERALEEVVVVDVVAGVDVAIVDVVDVDVVDVDVNDVDVAVFVVEVVAVILVLLMGCLHELMLFDEVVGRDLRW